MPVLDFKEIAQANCSTGQQDMFEKFTRDLLESMGFKIVSGPDRGQDGGRDLIVIEQRRGLVGDTEFKWLVSCKHKAHSGQAVNDSDERDIIDRLEAHNASGFLGVYSTIISSPLGRKLEAMKSRYEVFILDNERIETLLLETDDKRRIAERYFPISYREWSQSNKSPSNLLNKYVPLVCKECGKDLLDGQVIDDQLGIIVFIYDSDYYKETGYQQKKYIDVYWSCKGRCDIKLNYTRKRKGIDSSWEDISDIAIPIRFISWMMAILNRMRAEEVIFEDEAFDKLKEFIIIVSQLVLKSQTDLQRERFESLTELPFYYLRK